MDRIKFEDAIEHLYETNSFLAVVIEDSINMLSSLFNRDLTEDEMMITYSSFLTGYSLPKIEQAVLGPEPPFISLN